MPQYKYIRPFAELGITDIALVGGKNASLGEMYRELSSRGVKVPNGFATTAAAFRDYLQHNGLTERIREALAGLDPHDMNALAQVSAEIRSWIIDGNLPSDLAQEIVAGYVELSREYGTNPDVAVRSSATAEDLPDASFAGQQETYLNVKGVDNLLRTCKRVLASLFTDRAIHYRVDKGFDHMSIALSIGVQKMVRSDKGASGVMFTLDTETGFRDVVLITAAYGLGENVVQGAVNPDEFYVHKPTLVGGWRPIIKRHLGDKAIKMVYARDAVTGQATENVQVRREDRQRFCISDEDVLALARYALAIEKHYSEKAGRPRPMDIEWAKDGLSGEIFIVQARPETVHSLKQGAFQDVYTLEKRGEVLVQGKSVGGKIAVGRTRIILEAEHMSELKPGEVLVTDMTDPDWEPIMRIAAAIVTNRGGRTCHAAIISRELGIPAVVGAGDATSVLHTGQEVTVSCAEGDVGFIYGGAMPFRKESIDMSSLGTPKTKIMLNVGSPEQAFEFAGLPAAGVGLARLEFIIANSIRIHPRALLEYFSLEPSLRHRIDSMIVGYPSPKDYYVSKLAEGIATIAAAFYPKPVIVRMSDFKSNEYAQLLGGDHFEPKEENPMIGFRGALRYYSKAFADCFALECAAVKRVREEMGLTNVEVMIPFCRTVDELRKVLDVMAKHDVRRGQNGLRVIVMCEIPSNALLADEFLEHCDGFSIGSNDLTQCTLGADRDSGILTGLDERNGAVLRLMEMAISACNEHGKYVGICGQAPSDFPEITSWLVEQGIQSISLNPDSVLTMTKVVLDMEQQKAAGEPAKKAAAASRSTQAQSHRITI